MSHPSGSSGRRRVVRAAAFVAAAVFALSGCGTDLQPGIAAKVTPPASDGSQTDTTTISQGHLDDVTEALCAYLKSSNGSSGGQRLPVALVRSNTALNFLVYFELMGALADSRGLTMRPSDIAAAVAQNPIPADLSDKDKGVLTDFFDDYSKAVLEQSTLAANMSDSSKTTSEGVKFGATAGSDGVVNAYFKQADVEINPADGTWDGRRVAASSGSLSDPVSSAAAAADKAIANNDVASLPPSQVCG